MTTTAMSNFLTTIYTVMLDHYGPQNWWPSDGPFETIVGAILTQNTAWTNADRAIERLKAAHMMSAEAIRTVPEPELAQLIRPSGYFNAKARKLKAMAEFLAIYGDDTESWRSREPKELRAELLAVHGIGPETADDIVLYCADLPSFVIDVYTQRIVTRLMPNLDLKGYEEFQALFEDNLPRNARLFNEYHALLDTHAKSACLKNRPLCDACSLLDLCPTGQWTGLGE